VQTVGIDDIMLTYSSEHWLGEGSDDGVQHWDIGMHFKDDGPGACLGTIEMYVIEDSYSPDIVEYLDHMSADLCTVGTALYDPERGYLRSDLEERLALMGKTTIVNRVRMDRRFRGQGLGIYLTGLALDYLSHGSGVIALFPSPLRDRDAPRPRPDSQQEVDKAARAEALARARARLGRAWSRLGFEHYRDGTWILDPGMRTLDDALYHEQQRLQNHRWEVTFTCTEAPTSVFSTEIEKAVLAKPVLPASSASTTENRLCEGPPPTNSKFSPNSDSIGA
jgi:GNAT superfamily N-acetyltransferase